jgi:hypothetical protein
MADAVRVSDILKWVAAWLGEHRGSCVFESLMRASMHRQDSLMFSCRLRSFEAVIGFWRCSCYLYILLILWGGHRCSQHTLLLILMGSLVGRAPWYSARGVLFPLRLASMASFSLHLAWLKTDDASFPKEHSVSCHLFRCLSTVKPDAK